MKTRNNFAFAFFSMGFLALALVLADAYGTALHELGNNDGAGALHVQIAHGSLEMYSALVLIGFVGAALIAPSHLWRAAVAATAGVMLQLFGYELNATSIDNKLIWSIWVAVGAIVLIEAARWLNRTFIWSGLFHISRRNKNVQPTVKSIETIRGERKAFLEQQIADLRVGGYDEELHLAEAELARLELW